MTRQRLHPALAEIDVVTPDDMYRTMGHSFSDHLRDRWRTIKLMKLPQQRGIAASGTLILAQGSGYANDPGTPVGPEQGFIWMLRRVIVTSNTATDAARYTLYSGSDPTLIDSAHLLEGFTSGVPAVVTPTVPATTVAQQNPYSQPVQVVITGGTITAVIVNGVTVGTAAGTYYVPAYGSISITYSVAPTWAWNATTFQGSPVGVGYYPGTDADWLFSGEQVYAQVQGATVGNQYVMSGIAVEVASERVGALVG